MTTGNTITLVEDRIEDLRQALVANNRGELFSLLFRPRVKHELVEGADAVVRTESVNKRLGEKILQLFGRCFNARKKKPSVKVDVLGELKPRKRAKKENA